MRPGKEHRHRESPLGGAAIQGERLGAAGLDRRVAALFAMMLAAFLSGCGGNRPPNPAEAECRAQVYNDPAVKRMITVQAGSLWLLKEQQGALIEAKRQALLSCLHARGLAPPGGVEAVQPPSATFRSLF